MAEQFRNAWQLGWLRFTGNGKLPALLLAALLFLWLSGSWKRHRAFFCYAAVSTFLCMVPVTAVILMRYQTRFYDYEWIWSMVPMTAAAAWGATEFLVPRNNALSSSRTGKNLPVLLLLMAVLALCGGPWRSGVDAKAQRERRDQAEKALSLVTESGDEEICLWAPKEILESARRQPGSPRLLYGRNLWEEALNAYSYDTCSGEIRELYLWMENVQREGTAQVDDGEGGERLIAGEDCLRTALGAGANRILLPERIDGETVEALAQPLHLTVSRAGGYYLLTK